MFRIECICAIGALGLSATLMAAAPAAAGRGRGFARGEFGAFGPETRGPAPTISTPATPTTRPDADGFIRRWMVLEPIPAIGVTQDDYRATISRQYFPNQLTVIPRDGEKVTVDGFDLKWHACESSSYNLNLYHFTYALKMSTANQFWWALTVVNAPEDMKNIRLAIGSNDASVWWLNGEEVIGIYGNRMDTIDDGVSRKLTLKKGPNVIRAAVANQMGPSDFCARFLDASDKPITNFSISLTVNGK